MPKYGEKTYVSDVKDLPEGEHFAIMEFDSIWIEGDERSRTNPGHGYPGYSENVVRYTIYHKREDWESEIHSRTVATNSYATKKNWVALIAKRPSIKTTVTVEIGNN
jgi:hypothetical protein